MNFTGTGADQAYIIPQTGQYSIDLAGAAGIGSAGGRTQGKIYLELGTVLTIKVGMIGNYDPAGNPVAGAWPDGGATGLSDQSRGGGGSTSILISGALVAVAGGGGGNFINTTYAGGGGTSGMRGNNCDPGNSYAHGAGAPETADYSAGGNGTNGRGGTGPARKTATYLVSCGGGGGFFCGGGGSLAGGGGSGWTGSLYAASMSSYFTASGYANIAYIGPDPSGVMPGIPLTIRVRATTANCYVEKDIIVRVLGYCVHATFAIPALVVSTPVSYQLPLSPGTGYAPIVWSTSGSVPPGLTLSSAGLLSGTPNTTGTYNWSAISIDDSGAVATTPVSSVVS